MQSTNSKYGLLYQATCHVTFTNIYIFNLTENGRSSQALCLMGYLGIFRYSQINMVVRTWLLYVHAVRRAVCGLAKLDLDLCTQAVWLLTLLSVCISHFGCEKYRLIVSSQCFSCMSNSFWINMNRFVFDSTPPSWNQMNLTDLSMNRKTTVIRPMRENLFETSYTWLTELSTCCTYWNDTTTQSTTVVL